MHGIFIPEFVKYGERTFVGYDKGCLTITGTSSCPAWGDECVMDTTCESCGNTYTEADADGSLIGTVEGRLVAGMCAMVVGIFVCPYAGCELTMFTGWWDADEDERDMVEFVDVCFDVDGNGMPKLKLLALSVDFVCSYATILTPLTGCSVSCCKYRNCAEVCGALLVYSFGLVIFMKHCSRTSIKRFFRQSYSIDHILSLSLIHI